MRFKWKDYSNIHENELESWMSDKDILKYACNSSFKDDYEYYLNCNEYKLGESFFCKVVTDNNIILAVLILLGGKDYPLTINPIIVNPLYHNKGYGSLVIKDLVNNIKTIIPYNYKYLQAGIDINNKASIRVFEKCGFYLHSTHPDGDFLFYRYML